MKNTNANHARLDVLDQTALGQRMSRRTWLKSAFAFAALPALDAFMPIRAQAQTVNKNFLAYFFPCGRVPQWWQGNINNGDLTLPNEVAALRPFTDQFLSVNNIYNKEGVDGPGAAHAKGTSSCMTATRITSLPTVNLNISVDQVIANEVFANAGTRYRSLQWTAGEPGPCDVGNAACVYTQAMSWAGPTSALTPVMSPYNAFRQLFPAENIRRESMKSVIDFIAGEGRNLRRDLGKSDQERLEEFFTSVRDIETRLEADTGSCEATRNVSKTGLDYTARVDAFNDLMVMALQCEQTHVLTFMIEFGLSGRSHQEIPQIANSSSAGSQGHHALSHNGSGAGRSAHREVERWQAEKFGSFLEKLRATAHPSGENLFDRTLVLGMPSMGEGNSHDHSRLSPVLIGGGGIVNNQGGRVVNKNSSQSDMLGNFHVALMDAFGVDQGKRFGRNGFRFGDSGERAMTGIL